MHAGRFQRERKKELNRSPLEGRERTPGSKEEYNLLCRMGGGKEKEKKKSLGCHDRIGSTCETKGAKKEEERWGGKEKWEDSFPV